MTSFLAPFCQIHCICSALADRLVAKLSRIPAEHHDLTRMLDKFCSDNR